MTTPKKTDMKRLSQPQYFHLVTWLKENVEKCPPGTTHAAIAELASATLGFDISAFSVGDAMRAFELKVPSPVVKSDAEKIAVLAGVVASLWGVVYPHTEMPSALKEMLK